MEYTIIRNVIRYGMVNQYTYEIWELPKISVSTNYHHYIKQASWYAEFNNRWCVEQSNVFPKRWTDFIPIINAFVTFFYHRKYRILCDGINVGIVDKCRETGKITERRRFIIHGKEYFIGIGNTRECYPDGGYEWPIEQGNGKVIAIVKKSSNEAIYKLKNLGDLPIEILVIMVMMNDIYRFSNENERTITSAEFG